MKYSGRDLLRRAIKRFVYYTAALILFFATMFFLSDNTLNNDIGVLLFLVGMAAAIGLIVSIFGVIWGWVYGDEDPRRRKKDVR